MSVTLEFLCSLGSKETGGMMTFKLNYLNPIANRLHNTSDGSRKDRESGRVEASVAYGRST